MTAIAHVTIVMERTYKANPTRVFAAWESVEARERWSAPTDEIRIKYEEADFREGGRDVVRCIEKEGPDFLATVHYLDIRRGESLVFTECVARGNANLSAALICVELSPAGAGAALKLTMQIAGLGGSGMEQNYHYGWSLALDNLGKEFDQ